MYIYIYIYIYIYYVCIYIYIYIYNGDGREDGWVRGERRRVPAGFDALAFAPRFRDWGWAPGIT